MNKQQALNKLAAAFMKQRNVLYIAPTAAEAELFASQARTEVMLCVGAEKAPVQNASTGFAFGVINKFGRASDGYVWAIGCDNPPKSWPDSRYDVMIVNRSCVFHRVVLDAMQATRRVRA